MINKKRSRMEHCIVCTQPSKVDCAQCSVYRLELWHHSRTCKEETCDSPFCLELRSQKSFDAAFKQIDSQVSSKSEEVRFEGDDYLVASTVDTTTSNETNTTNSSSSNDVVKLLGHFDGCKSFNGKWHFQNSKEESTFAYTFKEDDIFDPDQSIPCFKCNKVETTLQDVVCDLCDRVFHLKCANLKQLPSKKESFFCEGCKIINSMFLPENEIKKKLPPNRQWQGKFLMPKGAIFEKFTLEFTWKSTPSLSQPDFIIADVSGQGSNKYGKYKLTGIVKSYDSKSKGFPMEILKSYLEKIDST